MDRLAALLDPTNTTLNGIDFVEITTDDQTGLAVHFLTTVTVSGTLAGARPVTISGGDTIPTVGLEPVTASDWTVDAEGRPLLALRALHPGDFSEYRLHVESPALDAYYATVAFSFKARCPSDLDCEVTDQPCPPLDGPRPPIDYLAKDFQSFRQALIDFSAQRYPSWVERSEADVGIVLLELLAAEGDDLSYLQDAVAAQATLSTATERRSIVRHARIVDYEPRPATSARVTVQLDVALAGAVPAGAVVSATRPDGGTIDFEVGAGLVDPVTGEPDTTPIVTDPRWNRLDHTTGTARIEPYWWDDSQRCLPRGATQMWVRGHGFAFPTGDPANDLPGLALLVDTASEMTADPPERQVVHLTAAIEETDELLAVDVTHLRWSGAEALAAEHDLARTVLAGNLVPASEGRRHREFFEIEPVPGDATEPAVVRTGPNAGCTDPSPIYLHTLRQGRLAWLEPAVTLTGVPTLPLPEVLLDGQGPGVSDPVVPWPWRRSLLQTLPFERAFTVDPLVYRNLAELPIDPVHWEYDGDAGDSLRFGDGVFGERPRRQTTFEVTYRVTTGAGGNVAADTITGFDPAMKNVILSVTNPFVATGGADEEPAEQVRRLAPHAFRAKQFRAVRAADYEAVAEELDWVLDAGTAFRWTGSWTTVFTTADPRGREQIAIAEHLQLIDLLERRRLAGYESYTPSPRYVGLDLVVVVCARHDAFQAEVHEALLVDLGTAAAANGAPAFFALDRFRFGTALERSALEAAIQGVHGVDGVVAIRYRRRGQSPLFVTMPDTVRVAHDEIIRVDNDRDHPDRGSLRVVVEGGK